MRCCAAAAKAITSFNKEHEVLTYKGGIMGDTLLDEGRFTAISKLPSRDVLNGQLAGMVASPLVMWLGVSREQFAPKPKKVIEGANEDGAVV